MTEKNEDLWPPDLVIASIVTPAAILRAQAALLGERTKGVLEGVVETSSVGSDIYHRFVIKVPALGNYRYALFSVHHPVTLYPVFIDEEPATPRSTFMPDFSSMPEFSSLGDRLDKASGLKNEEALREWLRRTLGSDATKHIIANLYAQASGQ
jgi:hypothetical protein